MQLVGLVAAGACEPGGVSRYPYLLMRFCAQSSAVPPDPERVLQGLSVCSCQDGQTQE